MFISFLLPTRKRIHWLKEVFENLKGKTRNVIDIEILLAIDDDDIETQNFVEEFMKTSQLNIKKIITQRFGYHALHEYINRLCAISTGRLLFLWNDDALIETQNWDDIIREEHMKRTTEYEVYDFSNNHSGFIFPLISRKIYECLGHYSLQAHNDSWMLWTVRDFGLNKMIKNIKIHHRRVDAFLAEYKEVNDSINNHKTSNDFFSKEIQSLIQIDKEKLKKALALEKIRISLELINNNLLVIRNSLDALK